MFPALCSVTQRIRLSGPAAPSSLLSGPRDALMRKLGKTWAKNRPRNRVEMSRGVRAVESIISLRQGFRLESSVVQLDLSAQSSYRLQCCRFIAEGLERSDHDSAMLSLISGARLPPSVLPDIRSTTPRRSNEASFLHNSSTPP